VFIINAVLNTNACITRQMTYSNRNISLSVKITNSR